jgi:DsbC/DsbD-like thiol-disulfide interchange protein
MTRIPALLAIAAISLALFSASAHARTTRQDDVLKASFLSGWQTDSGTHMAGLRLDLAPGWKTYWRSPGDAGIPPQFDWAGSENLKSARIHWPSPVAFHTNGYLTIGYKGGVVLPVELVARDPARPIVLNARVDLGICRDICMPASVELQATVTAPGQPDTAISAALAALPRSGTDAGLKTATCTVEPIADGLRVTATLTLPPQGKAEEVAFETGDPRIWVSESQSSREGAQLVSSAELVGPGGQPFALDRSALTLTVIADSGAVEIHGCPSP